MQIAEPRGNPSSTQSNTPSSTQIQSSSNSILDISPVNLNPFAKNKRPTTQTPIEIITIDEEPEIKRETRTPSPKRTRIMEVRGGAQ